MQPNKIKNKDKKCKKVTQIVLYFLNSFLLFSKTIQLSKGV